MSDGYRNGAFALGLTALVLTITLFAVASGSLFRSANCYKYYTEIHQSEEAKNQNYENCTSPPWVSVYKSLVTGGDGLAQWLMTIFAFLGLLLSALAIYWIKRTLEVTRDMALDQRRIGEAQVRAYLTPALVQVSCNADSHCLTFRCNITNNGQSPAIDAYALVKVSLFIDDGIVEHKLFHEIGDIPVGHSEGPQMSYSDVKISHNKFKSSGACHIQIRIIARDVFKRPVDASGFFMAGGHPEIDVGYIMTNMATPLHDKIGLGIKETDFAHLVPNWRKPNFGKGE